MKKKAVRPFSRIAIRGASQNNLKNVSLDIDLGKLTVVTGVSGSGKSSLVFDTLYAEGQRRYVETLSPYARQFLDRMDRPHVEKIEGVPPAIAIDQTNPVRTSRSTVGTMTELNDHLKLLFAKCAKLFCPHCGKAVEEESPQTIWSRICLDAAAAGDPRLTLTFTSHVPKKFGLKKALDALSAQGFTRIYRQTAVKDGWDLEVTADRFRSALRTERSRGVEAVEQALRLGQGTLSVFALDSEGNETSHWKYASDFACADCGLSFSRPTPAAFSFNSPLGACPVCRGFGRVIGVDMGLVIPNPKLTLRQKAVKPWSTPSFAECQQDMERYAAARGIDLDTPFEELPPKSQEFIREGEPGWKDWNTQWYGIRHFFEWLESKAYKMHIRVLLSRYRSYTECPECRGSRLKAESLYWRAGRAEDALAAETPRGDERAFFRFRAPGVTVSDQILQTLPGLTIHDLMQLPLGRLLRFFESMDKDPELSPEARPILTEILSRVRFLCAAGVSYLTLDRQCRTLSGGEIQRLNLTTALGTSLVNTLFILDEPSIGLHPRDMDRINGIMRRLTDAGNTLVVVEHDPQVMLQADRIIDMGPGAGEKGGSIVFSGTPEELASSGTLTADYLSGKHRISFPRRTDVSDKDCVIRISGVSANNLRDIAASFPLHALTCLTGVSGSGKSTLIQNVLVPALQKALGVPSEAPGPYRTLEGAELIDAVDFVDQSPIGKTSRSNPVSYVGAFDPIRKLLASTDTAKMQGWTPGTFSFNSGDGRCPACMGSGYEHVEMQFLSDVYLQCPDCGGKRYRTEVLEAKLERNGRQASVADILDMTVTEALEFFSNDPEVTGLLQPLIDVGLEYVRLGQPVPTLSGGEAQRLKLAGFLASALHVSPKAASENRGRLLIFDEPTTGLHFSDIEKLLGAMRKLIGAGHSVIVIEHNLDVISNADWIIDLGPEGGDAGGRIVAAGTVEDIMKTASSYTGQALLSYFEALESKGPFRSRFTEESSANADENFSVQSLQPQHAREGLISVLHAREHNLRDLCADIPRGSFTAVTGLSGSGKSTLAFDIVFSEGQRRYLESLNVYARSIIQPSGRADVDAVLGIPPTVAIEQRTSRGGRKSTVATMTEAYHFLRLLFVKLGIQTCPDCGAEVTPQTPAAIAETIRKNFSGQNVTLLAPLVVHRKGIYTEIAAWAKKRGYKNLRVDGVMADTSRFPKLARYAEHSIELPVAEFTVSEKTLPELKAHLATALTLGKGLAGVLCGEDFTLWSVKRACPNCGTSFPDPDPRLFSYNSRMGWCQKCFGVGTVLSGFDAEQTGEESSWSESTGKEEPCPECHGKRLSRVALAVKFLGRSISDICEMPVNEALDFFRSIRLSGRDAAIASDAVREIVSRLSFLQQVGLGYLSLDRAAPTLSGGEAQRIRLASQLGSNLQGVCYVLDEPTIGLHPKDNGVLLSAMDQLSKKGNTLLVVEHDEETIRRADHVIDIGPGAGSEGGELVAEGTVEDIMAAPRSVTGRFLASPQTHAAKPRREVIPGETPCISVLDASMHNLNISRADFPLNRLTVVTGVSGSGKSTLCRSVLLESLQSAVKNGSGTANLTGCREILGADAVRRVLEVDQTPIGKTPRSCPATYVGIWDAIRKVFAEANLAHERGYGASRFSFNTKGGRCETCLGQGLRTIEMNFLPDVKVLCESCSGKRFNPQTLDVKWKDKSIGDILQMPVREAADFFESMPSIQKPLLLLRDVGLGYLTLGQPSPTLSGGEAQRLKLVTELSKVRSTVKNPDLSRTDTVYVLDEPTVGLHMADVERLTQVLHRLVDAGNTVIVIEHNLDVMAEADWIIDIGPEGGSAGGRIVAEGAPRDIAKKKTATGTALRDFFRSHKAARK